MDRELEHFKSWFSGFAGCVDERSIRRRGLPRLVMVQISAGASTSLSSVRKRTIKMLLRQSLVLARLQLSLRAGGSHYGLSVIGKIRYSSPDHRYCPTSDWILSSGSGCRRRNPRHRKSGLSAGLFVHSEQNMDFAREFLTPPIIGFSDRDIFSHIIPEIGTKPLDSNLRPNQTHTIA